MKKIPVEEAVGMELCHDITGMWDGFKGAAFKRGHIIQSEDIPKLLDIGKRNIFVWEAGAGEIHEEDAAFRLSQVNIIPGTHYTDVSEGKVLLVSDTRGMLRVDTVLLNEVNSIGDITITTLPDHYPVEPGMRLSSMRIVPLVTKESRIILAEELCRERRLIDLVPYKEMKAAVIIVGSEIYNGRIKDKFEPVMREKLGKYPTDLLGVTICDDDVEMIGNAGRDYLSKGADIIFFTGGMSVDPDDITPTAIRSLGADIITHGVPSQPGNMTLVSYSGNVAMIGVPGASISMPTTILDVILPQLFTGIKLTKEDLINLGDGGLCQLCGREKCHFPNCTFGRY